VPNSTAAAYGSRRSRRRRRFVKLDARILKQHARGLPCGARHGWIVAHQILRDRAIDEKRELRRQIVGIGDIEPLQQLAEPDAAALLESGRDLFDGAVLGAQLRNRVDERAAAKVPAGKAPLERIEGTEDLVGRRLVGRARLHETPRQIG
jgi:hypothetical protein